MDRRCCRDATPATGWHNFTRYGDAWPYRQLNTMTPTLYTTLSGTSSQCSSVSEWVWIFISGAELAKQSQRRRYAGVATSLGRTCGYRWPHGHRRSTFNVLLVKMTSNCCCYCCCCCCVVHATASCTNCHMFGHFYSDFASTWPYSKTVFYQRRFHSPLQTGKRQQLREHTMHRKLYS